MRITLEQFKKFADENDILWFYNRPVWKTVRGRRIFPKINPKNLRFHDDTQKEFSKTPVMDVVNDVKAGLKQKKEETMKSNIGIARVCHEANRQYCIDNQLTVNPEWDELPVEIQSSIITGVAEVITDPKITAAEMHQKWCDFRESKGWKYALSFNAKLKTHPNLVPFKKLSKVEQGKDKLFIRTVKAEMKK